MRRKRPGDDFPVERKFGHARAVEMAEIEDELRARGASGPSLHFEAVRTYEVRHAGDPTFRERQAAWLARQAPGAPDPFRKALEAIRDGHNDPPGPR